MCCLQGRETQDTRQACVNEDVPAFNLCVIDWHVSALLFKCPVMVEITISFSVTSLVLITTNPVLEEQSWRLSANTLFDFTRSNDITTPKQSANIYFMDHTADVIVLLMGHHGLFTLQERILLLGLSYKCINHIINHNTSSLQWNIILSVVYTLKELHGTNLPLWVT